MKKGKRPLAQCDPDSDWETEAKRLGLSVIELREQIALADSIIEELFAEERFREQSKRWFLRPSNNG